MNILYFHGLERKLSPAKRKILEKYGKVYAPDVDYNQNPDAIETILELYNDIDINTVMGSSMGGFVAYHVSNALFRPALLFNPALKKRPVLQNIPSDYNNYNNLKQIIIGQSDDVVIPADTLFFISENFNPVTDLYLRLVPRVGHRISKELFEEEVETFFGKLCY